MIPLTIGGAYCFWKHVHQSDDLILKILRRKNSEANKKENNNIHALHFSQTRGENDELRHGLVRRGREGLRDAARAAGPHAADRQLAVGLAHGARGEAARLAAREAVIDVVLAHDALADLAHLENGAAAHAEEALGAAEGVDVALQRHLLAADAARHAQPPVDSNVRGGAAIAEAGVPRHFLTMVM
jgi:hypothetical protein